MSCESLCCYVWMSFSMMSETPPLFIKQQLNVGLTPKIDNPGTV